MLRRALTRFLGRESDWAHAAEPPLVAPAPRPQAGGVRELLERVHPLAAHTRRLRRMLALPMARRGAHFDDVRRRYGLRREFSAWRVACSDVAPDTVAELRALGFACDDPPADRHCSA
jgi:hypothetical protein